MRNVISEVKEQLLKDILQDEVIVKLLANKTDVTLPAKALRYKQVFPWMKVPKVAEEARTFITFDVTRLPPITGATRLYQLDIWVLVHDSMMVVDKQAADSLGLEDLRGVRTDLLENCIDATPTHEIQYRVAGYQEVRKAPFICIQDTEIEKLLQICRCTNLKLPELLNVYTAILGNLITLKNGAGRWLWGTYMTGICGICADTFFKYRAA